MNTLNIRSERDVFEKVFICPITQHLLRKAVSLYPCAHKINQGLAQEIFGVLRDNACTKLNACPVCNKKVRGYSIDHTIRNIVAECFPLGLNPQTASLLIEEQNEDVPYPGKKGRFVYEKGYQGPIEHFFNHNYRIYFLDFISKTPDSLIQNFSFVGRGDGSVKISIRFNETASQFGKFMRCNGMPMTNFELRTRSYTTETLGQLKSLCRILDENNEITDARFKQMCKLIANQIESVHITHTTHFKLNFLCPVEQSLLRDPVSLYPCAHKINAGPAIQLFGPSNASNSFSCDRPAPCPTCKIIVQGHSYDHTIKTLVEKCFPFNTACLQTSLPQPAKDKHSAYPGESGRFIHSGGSLDTILEFRSVTSGSIVDEFCFIQSYDKSSVSIRIKFTGDCLISKVFANFMKANGIEMSCTDVTEGSYMTKTLSEAKILFKILAENNQIQMPYFEQMSKLIAE